MKIHALIQHFNNTFASVASLLLGVNEIMFLGGLLMLFYGLAGLWSVYGALTVCGGVLIAVAVLGSASKRGKGPEA